MYVGLTTEQHRPDHSSVFYEKKGLAANTSAYIAKKKKICVLVL
jgi:hypothetical protein